MHQQLSEYTSLSTEDHQRRLSDELDDPYYDQEDIELETIFENDHSIVEQHPDHEHLIRSTPDEEEQGNEDQENSPYAEVRAAVPITDEMSRVNHWRTWALTLVFVALFPLLISSFLSGIRALESGS